MTVKPGIQRITIDNQCGAYSKFFEIPKYIQGQSEKNTTLSVAGPIKSFKLNIWNHLGSLFKKVNVSDSLIQNISLLSPLYKAPINELMSQLNMAEINTHQVSVDNYSLTPHEITGFSISGSYLL